MVQLKGNIKHQLYHCVTEGNTKYQLYHGATEG